VPRHPDAQRRRSSRRRVCAMRSSRRRACATRSSRRRAARRAASRVTCRGTRTRSRGEVVDDEPALGGVVDDEPRDDPRDEPRDVPRHPDARRR
jgi:hypothetical protein